MNAETDPIEYTTDGLILTLGPERLSYIKAVAESGDWGQLDDGITTVVESDLRRYALDRPDLYPALGVPIDPTPEQRRNAAMFLVVLLGNELKNWGPGRIEIKADAEAVRFVAVP